MGRLYKQNLTEKRDRGKFMKEKAKQAYEFVLYCYFGDMGDPVEAAIDRAYVDMASHTLTGLKNDPEKKWELRYRASEKIKQRMKSISADYDRWHQKTCELIQEIYIQKGVGFTYGQAQKWLNMTMKYLYVFSLIFEDMEDKRLCEIPGFIRNHHEKLHIPIDNYILSDLSLQKYAPWSKMSMEDYNACRKDMGEKDIDWELEKWNMASELYKINDRTSYAYYKEKNSGPLSWLEP